MVEVMLSDRELRELNEDLLYAASIYSLKRVGGKKASFPVTMKTTENRYYYTVERINFLFVVIETKKLFSNLRRTTHN